MKSILLAGKLRLGGMMLVVGLVAFLASMSPVHAMSSSASSARMQATSTMAGKVFQGHLGQKQIIPLKNGGAIVLISSFTPAKGTTTSSSMTPNVSGECGTAGIVENYTGLGFTWWTYSLYDYFCYNGSAITSIRQPTYNASSIFGVTLSRHSERNAWASQPYSAYAVGTYDFLLGIPTPWAGIGAVCNSYVELDMYGTGYINYINPNCF